MPKNSTKNSKYLSFKEARCFVRSLGLKCQREWEEYSKNLRPSNIPSTPSRYYRGVGWRSWMDWLDTNNHIGFPHKRKYSINQDFFKEWSSDMAYILGFWFADGWISGDNKFGIIQHKNDRYILEAILSRMQSNHKLQSNKCHQCYSIEICSKTIVDDIKRLGGVNQKSLVVKFPSVPKEYLPDFIRGLWDGDGCVSYSKYRRGYVSIYVCASYEFINSFLKVLKKEIVGLKSEKIYARQRKNMLYSLSFGQNDTILLRDYMYRNGIPEIMLVRKFQKFSLAGERKKIGRKCGVYLSFEDARFIVSQEKLKTTVMWRDYSRSRRPSNIPSMPNYYYKDKGWMGWDHFLGTEFTKDNS